MAGEVALAGISLRPFKKPRFTEKSSQRLKTRDNFLEFDTCPSPRHELSLALLKPYSTD